MATVSINTIKQFKDLDLLFTVHPIRKDINKHNGAQAVINSIKNLLLTNHYERPFQPELGSNIRKLLFEPMDGVTTSALETEIIQTIENFEPRVLVSKLTAVPNFDQDGYSIELEFYIKNMTDMVSITFFLERVR